ncbi:MAG TPA: DUF4097 family beta strand repeat-containing protein [Bryobacteraceae bacterium]|nr:DUF4097 family beta strand repeat-containing protein [Bryobacteraceae bacterium]
MAVLAFASLPLLAQAPRMRCDDSSRWGRDQVPFCEIREYNLAAPARIAVDAGTNGGITVFGWSQQNVLVRAKVQTSAPTEGEARAQAGQINVQTAGGEIRADAPDFGRNRGYAVSYEIFVPHRMDLSLKAHNGGISVENVRGTIQFATTNGGVSLKGLAGDVKGHTTNGGLSIELDGNRWDGAGLDATTTNGGVKMRVPANYSARLETGTTNGGLSVDFPVTVRGDIGRRLSVDIGGGGAPVRATTTNGGVKIARKG